MGAGLAMRHLHEDLRPRSASRVPRVVQSVRGRHTSRSERLPRRANSSCCFCSTRASRTASPCSCRARAEPAAPAHGCAAATSADAPLPRFAGSAPPRPPALRSRARAWRGRPGNRAAGRLAGPARARLPGSPRTRRGSLATGRACPGPAAGAGAASAAPPWPRPAARRELQHRLQSERRCHQASSSRKRARQLATSARSCRSCCRNAMSCGYNATARSTTGSAPRT